MMVLSNQISIDLEEDICLSLLWKQNLLIIICCDLTLNKLIFLLNKVIHV